MPKVTLNDAEMNALRDVLAGAKGTLDYHANADDNREVRDFDQAESERLGLVLDDLRERQWGRS